MDNSPAFGQADLTNCERELIHLAGSIQPHGMLLVVRERDGLVVQASANSQAWLGLAAEQLLNRPLAVLEGDIAPQLQALLSTPGLHEPLALPVQIVVAGRPCRFLAMVHRVPGQGVLVLELEAPDGSTAALAPQIDSAALPKRLTAAVQRLTQAASVGVLNDGLVSCVRDLTGYDRVMVYKFDEDGHGKIVAEARDPRLETLLGHHYPSSDIPQRARALYLSNRVRVLADVHCQAVPLVPALLPADPAQPGAQPTELDMSMCTLRSMSPLHLQYLKNMGVSGTLVVSLVREGRLWGLIAAHHYSSRVVQPMVRAACDLLAEVACTRMAAIENHAYAQVAVLVRRLEQRLVEATSTEGDWRLALFRNPRTLLQPLEATGAALFHDGELLTIGEVPSTPELWAMLPWIDSSYSDPPLACSSVAKANPALESLTAVASGVLAVKLSSQLPDYLVWFRKEQLLTVSWAGDPAKPMVNNDPLTLSPRRSFAIWSEIVRGTALPWSGAEKALARAIGEALSDIIVQVNAVRLLVAEHQLAGVRATVQGSPEPAAVVDADGKVLFANQALHQLLGALPHGLDTMDDVAGFFEQPHQVHAALASVRNLRQAWRGELMLDVSANRSEPQLAGIRMELVPGRRGQALGFILVLHDLSDSRRVQAARRHVEETLRQASTAVPPGAGTADQVIGAIVTNASMAAMDIADSAIGPGVARLLEDVEVSAERATALYRRIQQQTGWSGDGPAVRDAGPP